MAHSYHHLLFLFSLLIILHSTPATSQTSPPVSLPGCKNKCGNITVPYPFGIDLSCYRDGFLLVCDETSNPPKLSIYDYGYEITDISPNTGELNIWVPVKRACYNSSGGVTSSTSVVTDIILDPSPYLLSSSNNFYSVGCPNQGYFSDQKGNIRGGCISACPAENSLGSTNGSCMGDGCCRSSIPNGLSFYVAALQQLEPPKEILPDITMTLASSTNCSYVFLADSNWFQFDNSYLKRSNDFQTQVRVDWAIRNVRNCSYARRNMTDYACRSANHQCYNSDNGSGYLCKCSQHYQGNPYITGGCQGTIIYSS